MQYDAEMLYFSDDKKRMAVAEWVLYELDYVDDAGTHHYKPIGITNLLEQADNYIANQICTYNTITADNTTSINDEEG